MLAILHPELNISWLLPAGEVATAAISCCQKCTPQGGVTRPFSPHSRLQEMPPSSYVFPPHSVKLLLGCGHSFSFLSAPMDCGNRIFPHCHGYSQGGLEFGLHIPGTGKKPDSRGAGSSGPGLGPSSGAVPSAFIFI